MTDARGLPTATTANEHWSWSCRHEQTEVRSKVNNAGVVTHVKQCLKCGRWAGSVKRKGVAPPFDESLVQRVEAERAAFSEMQAMRIRSDLQRQRLQRQRDYKKYLVSDVWRHKRAMVLKRCDGKCESCGVRPASEVHHTAYPECFGDEPLWDLRGVCRSCHARIHGRQE